MYLLIGLLAVGVGWGLFVEMQTHRALSPFWRRGDQTRRWLERFPATDAADSEAYHHLLADAFDFSVEQVNCLQPDDRLMEVYRAKYPRGSLGDCLELERLGMALTERHGVDLLSIWQNDITLGEVFEQTRNAARS